MRGFGMRNATCTRSKNPLGQITRNDVIIKAKRIFKCDSARIIEFDHTPRKFLVIGFKRRSEGEWQKHDADGVHPMNFDYLQETTVGIGDTWEKLLENAKWFKSLEGMSMTEFLLRISKKKKLANPKTL